MSDSNKTVNNRKKTKTSVKFELRCTVLTYVGTIVALRFSQTKLSELLNLFQCKLLCSMSGTLCNILICYVANRRNHYTVDFG